jgi:DNA polymerase III gamma/tau subunit
MSFESEIQQWVQLDNQLKQLNEKVKEVREKRRSLENNINNHVQTNKLSNAAVKIGDSRLKFANTKVYEPLTYKYLEKTLYDVIKQESQIKTIMECIKQNRSFKIIPEIKRFSNN